MPNWLAFALITLAFAAVATWVSRRLLDTPVGWLRSLIFSIVVFSLSIPLVLWMLEQSNVYADGRFLVAWPIATTILALILGWVFALVVVVIVVSEFLVPTRPLRNPIVVIRNAIRRRDRARRYAQIVVIASRHGIGLYQNRARGYSDELPEALVGALNEAGVTFVKLGQVLSSRADVRPHSSSTRCPRSRWTPPRSHGQRPRRRSATSCVAPSTRCSPPSIRPRWLRHPLHRSTPQR